MKKRFLPMLLVLCMVMSLMSTVVFAAEAQEEPTVFVPLVLGEEASASNSVTEDGVTTIRTVKVTVSELTTMINKIVGSNFTGPVSALKFDRNSSADQAAQRKIRDLYTDNGHFTDPSTITVTNAPASYPFQYVGSGDYSGHYVSHIRVIYDRDEAGNPIKDENGNYVIKELQHSNGTPLTYKGVPTTNINGPFDQTTGTRPSQFLLMNEGGDYLYAYCVDMDTPTADGDPFYAMYNLEDGNYYASEEAENHIRAITHNGYWGTAEGFGSLAAMKEALKKAVADGTVDKDYEINFVHRKDYKEGYELKEGEIIIGSRVYWYTTEKITLTDEVIDALTEGEALDATQSAIWSWANGSTATLDGTDRMIIGDITYASCALGDSRNKADDYAGAARTKALYTYLMGLEYEEEPNVILNEKNFIKDMGLTVSSKVSDGVYNVSLNFSTVFTADVEKDDLTIVLTYVDADGVTQNITKKLTGEGALVAGENGFYTLDGLKLKAGEAFNFTMNVFGAQYIENGTYMYIAEGGINASQSMVGIASGTNAVDVVASFNSFFEVEEKYLANVVIEGTKYMDDELAGGFEFALMQGEEVLQTVTSDENGKFSFTLEYDEAGEYTYHIVEIDGGDEGIIYDETVYTVVVTVVLEDGKLVATVEGADAIEFYNETVIEIPETDPPLGPPQTGDAITAVIMAALSSLMGVCILPKRKETK